MLRRCGLFFILILFASVGVHGKNGVAELYSKLLENHNYLVPPTSNNISITINFALSNILKIDTRDQEMSFTAVFDLIWDDSSLSWNHEEFSHVNRVSVLSEKIWTPDIIIWNSNSANIQSFDGNVLISPEGKVRWRVFGYFKTSCTIDVTYYPFDQQTCIVKIGSTDANIQINSYKDSIDLDEYYMNAYWHVIESPAYRNVYETHDSEFPMETDVTYYLIIRRKTHWLSEVCPLFAFALLTIIPAVVKRHLDKLILQLFCIGGLFFLYMDLMNKLPPTSFVNALASKYIVSLILYNLVHLTLTAAVSNRLACLQRFVQQIPFRLTKSISNVSEKGDDEEDKAEKNDEIEKNQKQIDIVTIFNWIILILLIIVVSISTLHFILNPPHRSFP